LHINARDLEAGRWVEGRETECKALRVVDGDGTGAPQAIHQCGNLRHRERMADRFEEGVAARQIAESLDLEGHRFRRFPENRACARHRRNAYKRSGTWPAWIFAVCRLSSKRLTSSATRPASYIGS